MLLTELKHVEPKYTEKPIYYFFFIPVNQLCQSIGQFKNIFQLPAFEAGLWLIILTMFELKSNSIGFASTKNAKWQIAQAMKQKCIFLCM